MAGPGGPLEVGPLAEGGPPEVEAGEVWPGRDTKRPGPGRFGTERLAAWRGGRCAGWMRAEKVQAGLWIVAEAEVAGDDAGAALARGLAGRIGAPGMRVLAEGFDVDAPLRAWLGAGGWSVATEKLVVERRAPWPDEPVPAGFDLRSLADLGEEAFAAAMDRAAEGDPFEAEGPRDALAELRDLIALAGERFDPSGWFALMDDAQVAGVVLPQAWPGKDGTLYYVAVCPPWRGRGLGRALHAVGLRLLGERGVERYIGSTDTRNGAMVRVFARNGCSELARQLFYEAGQLFYEAGQ